MSGAHDIPGPCPICGGVTLAPATQRSTLLAVCDVLVLKALEKLGNYLVRADRSRFRILGTKSPTLAHTLWTPGDPLVDKVLKGAWDVVPALLDVHGCCDITAVQVTKMLDEYVHDLAITGTTHRLPELQYRFESRLGLPVFDRHSHDELVEA